MAASLTEVLARQIFRDRGLKLKLLRGPNEELKVTRGLHYDADATMVALEPY